MLSRRIGSFPRERAGSILPMFALALIPIVALIGVAVDYSRANAVRTALQAALDSTALAMAQNAASLNATDLQTQAQNYFNALFSKQPAGSVTLNVAYSATNGPQITISGSTTVKTTFMAVPGYGSKQLAVGGSATAAWGNTRLRVALALDNTGSMNDNGKMDALKSAAKNLIDQLKAAATNNGDVYVSIIPFARDVNVGSSNYTESWVDWSEYSSCGGLFWGCGGWGWGGGGSSHSSWNGCVKDRDQDYDTKNTTPTSTNASTYFPADQYDNCPVALMPLSYDWTALKNKITSMTPAGNTNTTIGLAWAWQSLSQGAPLNAPAEDSNYVYNKVIIFLTDGENTENRWTSTASQIDARMRLACTNAKTAGITIYTILVMDGNDTLLKNCASSSSNYFKITAASQLVSVFTQIGTNLSKLRVAK
jgi:Flp pilus assembly protein TadG